MAVTEIDVVFAGGPHDGKEGQYYGPDAGTVEVLYVSEEQGPGKPIYFAGDPDSPFGPEKGHIYRRAGTTRLNRERFTYEGRREG